jgi:DNA polymerase I
MLIKVDVKGLEWVSAVYLSQDKRGIQEVNDGYDQHAGNQQALSLPSRLIAKTFLFRIIYGGTAFDSDPDFADVRPGSKAAWEDRIWRFYNRYTGLAKWHKQIWEAAQEGRIYTSPTGREYRYERYKDGPSRPQVLNYPVQGLGADVVKVIRIELFKRLKGRKDVLMVNTVHDDIVFDCKEDSCYNICIEIDKVFQIAPQLFQQTYGVEFNLPIRGEISYGLNLKEMTEWQCDSK